MPAVLVTVIAIAAAIVLTQNSNAGCNPLRVNVTAQQFAWQFEYANGPAGGRKEPTLRLPLDRTVELSMRSKDVIHSFWVPEFGQKMDALPGRGVPASDQAPDHADESRDVPDHLHRALRPRAIRSCARTSLCMRPGEFNRWARSLQ